MKCNSMNLIFSKAEAAAAATATVTKEESLNWFASNRIHIKCTFDMIQHIFEMFVASCECDLRAPQSSAQEKKRIPTESHFNWLWKQFALQIQ